MSLKRQKIYENKPVIDYRKNSRSLKQVEGKYFSVVASSNSIQCVSSRSWITVESTSDFRETIPQQLKIHTIKSNKNGINSAERRKLPRNGSAEFNSVLISIQLDAHQCTMAPPTHISACE